MVTRFDLMKGIVQDYLQSLSDKVSVTCERENYAQMIIFMTDEQEYDYSNWNLIPINLILTDASIQITLRFCRDNKKYIVKDSMIEKMILLSNVEVNLGIEIGGFKYNLKEKYLKFESPMNYKDLPLQAWKGSLRDLVSNSLSTFRKYKTKYIKIFTRSPEETETISTKLYNQEILFNEIQISEQNIKDYQEIDPKVFKVIIHTRNPQLFAFDNVFINKTTNKRVYLVPKWSLLYYGKSGIFQLSSHKLSEFTRDLRKLSEEGIFFSKFPVKSIEYRNLSENKEDVSIKLGFNQLEKYLKTTISDPVRYKADLRSSLTSFLIKILKSRNSPSSNPNILNRILESEVKPPIDSELLGKGGFGEVYKNTYCGYTVGIKFMILTSSDMKKNMLLYKQYIAQNLSHPSIIKSYGYILSSNKGFGIVLEYCSNKSITEFFKAKGLIGSADLDNGLSTGDEASDQNCSRIHSIGPLNTEAIKFSSRDIIPRKDMLYYYQVRLDALLLIAHGLAYMHSRKIVHFDMKPHNVFLMENCRPKIADLGLSKNVAKKQDCRATDRRLDYSFPEQVSNESPDCSADVWGFGMTMYYVLLSQHPFALMRDKLKKNKALEKQKYLKLVKDKYFRPIIHENFEFMHPRECELMRECWNINKEQRPKMSKCVKELGRIKRQLIESVSRNNSQ